jgi:uncharacterized protein (DUF1330 family)
MVGDTPGHIKIVGLDVRDDSMYRRYREAMTPILHRYGGAFGYDLVVGEVLKSPVEARINRLFTMLFPAKGVADRFFSDPDYLKIRAALFEPAVASVTIIAEYDAPGLAESRS